MAQSRVDTQQSARAERRSLLFILQPGRTHLSSVSRIFWHRHSGQLFNVQCPTSNVHPQWPMSNCVGYSIQKRAQTPQPNSSVGVRGSRNRKPKLSRRKRLMRNSKTVELGTIEARSPTTHTPDLPHPKGMPPQRIQTVREPITSHAPSQAAPLRDHTWKDKSLLVLRTDSQAAGQVVSWSRNVYL